MAGREGGMKHCRKCGSPVLPISGCECDENNQTSTSKRSKKFREDRAVEAIIAGIMCGFTEEDWDRVYERVDEIEAKRKTKQIK